DGRDEARADVVVHGGAVVPELVRLLLCRAPDRRNRDALGMALEPLPGSAGRVLGAPRELGVEGAIHARGRCGQRAPLSGRGRADAIDPARRAIGIGRNVSGLADAFVRLADAEAAVLRLHAEHPADAPTRLVEDVRHAVARL